MRTGWLTFHDRKWLTLKRPLTVGGDTATFEIAVSRYVTRLVSDLTHDATFLKLFSPEVTKSIAVKSDGDIKAKPDKLKELRDSGTITEEEYTNTRKQILDNIWSDLHKNLRLAERIIQRGLRTMLSPEYSDASRHPNMIESATRI